MTGASPNFSAIFRALPAVGAAAAACTTGTSGMPANFFSAGARSAVAWKREKTLVVTQYTKTPCGKDAVSGIITAANARMPHFIPTWGSVPLGGFVSTDKRNVKDDNNGNAYVASATDKSVNQLAPPVANDGTPALIL